TLLAEFSYAQGDLSAAETQARTTARVLHGGGMNVEGPAYPAGILMSSLMQRGALDDAEQVLTEIGPEPWPEHGNLFFVLCARAQLRCLQGRDEEGLADLARARK